ncbi:MAG: hypothetical protein Q8P82_02170 [bacterium]|nr:hypothetical protein [bacterium]
MIENDKQEILEAINTFATHVDQKFEKIDQKFEKIDQRFDIFDQRFTSFEQTTNKQFAEVNGRIDKLYTAIDGFIQLHQKLEIELVALRAKYDRLEERLSKLEMQRA